MGAFGAKAAAGFILALMGAAFVAVGVAYLAYGLAVALTPFLGVAGSFAASGAIILIGPFMWAVITLVRNKREREEKAAKTEQNVMMTVLAALAVNKPLLAMGVAAIAGAADMWLKRRNRS